MLRDWPLVVPAMGRTRLPSGAFGVTLGFSAGERGGLTSGGALCGFQFPAQPLIFLFQPLAFFLLSHVVVHQLLVASADLVALFPRPPKFL
jgi:hypothetical protein